MLIEEQGLLGASARCGALAGGEGVRVGRGRLRGEQLVEVAEFEAEALEADFDLCGLGDGFTAADGDELGLGFAAVFLAFLGEQLACSGEGVAFAMDKLLDAECEFDIAAAIETLAGAALGGAKLGEFLFPEAQDVGFDTAEASSLADAEVEFVGNDGDGREPLFRSLFRHVTPRAGRSVPSCQRLQRV